MIPSVTLLMAIHCHQPVGNFGFVFEEAFTSAYDPFLHALERHPRVKLSLHYSGPLLDYLTARQPEFVRRVRTLARRGQVELLASGYYEPILPLLPEADRHGQIARMRAAIRKQFGDDASGLWLTERVWEPDLPSTLAAAGIRYTMIDSNQFAGLRAWLPASLQAHDESFWDLLGSYTTEHAGAAVRLFPASKRLRYWLPFQPVDRTIEYLKRLQRDEPVTITFADDGEKFGLWPKTHRWVYEEGWLDQFFSALERERAWLSTATFREHVERTAPSGSVYLPCGSYEEMLEWSGGSFRNFFLKYPEANAMQQKMLRVSRQVAALKAQMAEGSGLRALGKSRQPGAPNPEPRATLIQQAERELYAGQCNCAYWHGVFGGLYLSHLRRAVYRHLIAAEQLIRQASRRPAQVTVADVDGDGSEEAELATPAMTVVADPSEGGAITEWSLPGPRINLSDTFSRRYEPYHEKLKAAPAQAAVGTSGAPASIHDFVGVKEHGLAAHLIYDDHRRSGFLDYGLQAMPSLQDVVRSTWGERRLWSSAPYQLERSRAKRRTAEPLRMTMIRERPDGSLRKTVRVFTDHPALECRYDLDGVRVPVVALEFNLAVRDERYTASPGQVLNAERFDIAEPGVKVSLQLAIDPPATLFHFPVETVSESEAGLERTYQGLCVICCWSPSASGRWSSRLRWTVGS